MITLEIVRQFIAKAGEEIWFETDRDIEKDATYKQGFKDGVDALEAAFITMLEESDGGF